MPDISPDRAAWPLLLGELCLLLRYSIVEPCPRQNHASPSMSCFLVCLSAIGLALNVTVTEFVDTVCSRHILAYMTPSYILELFHVRKTIQIKIFKDE